MTSVACSLNDADFINRKRELRENVMVHVEQTREHPDGYDLRFAWSKERASELAEVVAFESACCPSLAFTLEIPPGQEKIWLRVRGDKAFLDEHLGQDKSRFTKIGAVLSAGGLFALACCLLPAIGITVGAGVAAWLDLAGGVLLVVGAVALVAGYVIARRSCGSEVC